MDYQGSNPTGADDEDIQKATVDEDDLELQGCLPVTFHNNSPVSDHGEAVTFPTVFPTDSYGECAGASGGESGVCGLHNLGNTCFMNAGLQCLMCNPQLGRYFLEEYSDVNTVNVTVTSSFYRLFSSMWSGKQKAIQPKEFKDLLGCYHPQFKDFRQHDCQEFLALLLDSLHEQLNKDSHSASAASESVPASQLVGHGDAPMTGDSDAVSSGSQCEMLLRPVDNCLNAVKSDQVVHRSSGTEMNPHATSLPDVLAGKSDTSEMSEVTQLCTEVSETSEHTKQGDISLEIGAGLMDRMTKDALLDRVTKDAPLDRVTKDALLDRMTTESKEADIIKLPAVVKTEMQSLSVDCDSLTCVGRVTANKTDQCTDPAAGGTQSSERCDSISESVMSSDDESGGGVIKLPSLEDLYMKDTKVKNTNVISSIVEEASITTDSEKFVKCDNVDVSQQVTEEFNHVEHLSDLLGYEGTATKGSADCCKPFKETNLLANMKDKFSGEFFSKKSLFSDLSPTGNEYSINNIKRMKIEADEKNVKMQAKRKVNVDKNLNQETMELSSRSEAGEGVVVAGPSSPGGLVYRLYNNEEQVRRKYMMEAQQAWSQYTETNQSAVVDAFHGQFKSTVVCSECHHLSVTFEPFMYLSVPLPHAMDRQISIVFIPCDKQPIRYLVTVNKNDCVKSVKQLLRTMIGEEACEVIMAEVLENHIARTLDDNMRLKFVNDTDRTIYAFEMIPSPEIDDPTNTSEAVDPNQPINNSQNLVVRANNSHESPATMSAQNNSILAVSSSAAVVNSEVAMTGSSHDTLLNNSSVMEEAGCSSTHHLELHPEVNWQHNLLGVEGPSYVSPSVMPVAAPCSERGVAAVVTSGEEGGAVEETDDWKSCAICLEEMIDSDLMVHTSCGGTLCQTCLDMTFKHYGEAAFQCPRSVLSPGKQVCSNTVDPCLEFIPLDCMADYKPKKRILSMSIMHRLDTPHEAAEDKVGSMQSSGEGSMQLFGHPNILYLTSTLPGETLYENVDRVVACPESYTILLTDGQGYHCARCTFTSHCHGCEVPREGQVSLQPGDHLTIRFLSLSPTHLASAEDYLNHSSMALKRSEQPLTLFNCFRAFTQSETLDEHNPWFCPGCRKNQCANKTMTVWRYPDTLIVYLKRFVFHNLSGSKIDSKVVFPLENLDLSHFISGPPSQTLTYDLQGCICHFGGVTSGHYTAYTKHPLTNEWHYFNDDTVTKQKPSGQDYSNAYILFYQRQGTNVEFHLPETLVDESKPENDYFMESMYHPVPSHFPSPMQDGSLGTNQDEPMNNDPGSEMKKMDCGSNDYDFYS